MAGAVLKHEDELSQQRMVEQGPYRNAGAEVPCPIQVPHGSVLQQLKQGLEPSIQAGEDGATASSQDTRREVPLTAGGGAGTRS